MTESGNAAPQPEATFESLENELQAVIRRLEDPAVPLEERLRLHGRAVSMHKGLEAILEAARKATAGDVERGSAPGDAAAGAAPEPYEAVRDRLAQVVNALEGDGLPLARVIELHAEARRLASRCEAILEGAQEKITRAAAGTPAAPGTGPDDAAG